MLFFHYLIEKESLNFHPDEDFTNYINLESELPSYTEEEAKFRNKLMEDCFTVCIRENVDIYSIGYELLYNKLKLEKS